MRQDHLVDYNLDALGSRNFEHMTQSLVTKAFGAKVVTFGDGPDGGREASWRGAVQGLGDVDAWDGYGVLQAKFKTFSESPEANLKWLKLEIRKELQSWADPDSKRNEVPQYILFSTNVRLSSVPGKGKDAIRRHIDATSKEFGLKFRDFRVLEKFDLSSLLDDADSIRRRFAAFITSGDVIAALLDAKEKRTSNWLRPCRHIQPGRCAMRA
jgi:hypothetical protein